MQGDSLSLLLFLISISPNLKKINNLPGISLVHKNITNLAFMDDITLFGKNEIELKEIVHKSKELLFKIHLNLNESKSGISESEIDGFENINETNTYKYLGFLKNKKVDLRRNKENIIYKSSHRVNAISNTRLSFRNIITALNESYLSLINYSSSVLKWSSVELKEINMIIRKSLKKAKMIQKYSNIDRLYLKRDNGGCRLIDAEISHDSQIIIISKKIKSESSNRHELICEANEKFDIDFKSIYKMVTSKYNISENSENTTAEKMKMTHQEKLQNNTNKKIPNKIFLENLKLSYIDDRNANNWIKKTDT